MHILRKGWAKRMGTRRKALFGNAIVATAVLALLAFAGIDPIAACAESSSGQVGLAGLEAYAGVPSDSGVPEGEFGNLAGAPTATLAQGGGGDLSGETAAGDLRVMLDLQDTLNLNDAAHR